MAQTLSKLFNVNPPEVRHRRKEMVDMGKTVAAISAGVPESKRSFDSTIKHLDKEKLRDAYMTDAVLYNGINEKVRIMFTAGFEFGDLKSNKVKEFYNDFRDNSDFDEVFEDCVRFYFIYSDSWMEKVKSKKYIDNVALINPETMEYKKVGGQPELDAKGHPVGYIQKLTTPTPQGEYEIPLKAEDVIHFNFFGVADMFYGLGDIEPIYNLSFSKVNMETGLGEVTLRLAYPKYYAQLGDEMHEPTQEQIDELAGDLATLDYESTLTVPYFYQVKILEPTRAHILREHLDYFIDQEITGLGVPKPYVTNGGESTNRATLGNLNDNFERTTRDYQRKFGRKIEKELLKPMAEEQGFKEYPKIIWGRLDLDSIDAKADRLAKYGKNGYIVPDLELENRLREEESLPLRKKAAVVEEPEAPKKPKVK